MGGSCRGTGLSRLWPTGHAVWPTGHAVFDSFSTSSYRIQLSGGDPSDSGEEVFTQGGQPRDLPHTRQSGLLYVVNGISNLMKREEAHVVFTK